MTSEFLKLLSGCKDAASTYDTFAISPYEYVHAKFMKKVSITEITYIKTVRILKPSQYSLIGGEVIYSMIVPIFFPSRANIMFSGLYPFRTNNFMRLAFKTFIASGSRIW